MSLLETDLQQAFESKKFTDYSLNSDGQFFIPAANETVGDFVFAVFEDQIGFSVDGVGRFTIYFDEYEGEHDSVVKQLENDFLEFISELVADRVVFWKLAELKGWFFIDETMRRKDIEQHLFTLLRDEGVDVAADTELVLLVWSGVL